MEVIQSISPSQNKLSDKAAMMPLNYGDSQIINLHNRGYTDPTKT